MPMLFPITWSTPTSPRIVEVSPAASATMADLIGAFATWVEAAAFDPIDSLTLEIRRDGASYSVTATNLGAGKWRAFADIGLFPGDESGIVKAVAVSTAGHRSVFTWSFSCHEGVGSTGALSDLAFVANVEASTVGELARAEMMNGVAPSSISHIEPTSAQAVGDLTFQDAGASFDVAAMIQVFGAMSGDAGAQLQPGFITASSMVAEHFTREFGEVQGETAIAQFHFVRAFFMLLSMFTVESGIEFTSEAEHVEHVDGQVMIEAEHTERVGSRTVDFGLVSALDNYKATITETATAASVGPEHIEPALNAQETISGSGIDSLFVISDETLESLIEE